MMKVQPKIFTNYILHASLLTETEGNSTKSYTYDANGNTLTAGDATYTYNARGQQTGYSTTTVSAIVDTVAPISPKSATNSSVAIEDAAIFTTLLPIRMVESNLS